MLVLAKVSGMTVKQQMYCLIFTCLVCFLQNELKSSTDM